eukprot:1885900-Prymnesium_polylepis.3
MAHRGGAARDFSLCSVGVGRRRWLGRFECWVWSRRATMANIETRLEKKRPVERRFAGGMSPGALRRGTAPSEMPHANDRGRPRGSGVL